MKNKVHHTLCKCNSDICGIRAADSRMIILSSRTDNHPQSATALTVYR